MNVHVAAVQSPSVSLSTVSSAALSESAEDATSLLECLSQIPDARHAHGVRYRQGSALALCVVAMICGRQNLIQIHRFGRDHCCCAS